MDECVMACPECTTVIALGKMQVNTCWKKLYNTGPVAMATQVCGTQRRADDACRLCIVAVLICPWILVFTNNPICVLLSFKCD